MPIEEHLLELSLGDFLRTRIDPDIRHTPTLRIAGRIRKPDWYSEKKKLLVEFDGPLHYTKSSIACRDCDQDRRAEQEGYRIIRIPYFIQLDDNAIKYFFNELTYDFSAFNTYPHGFIHSNVVFPADFCGFGIERYHVEFNDLPQRIAEDIIGSMLFWVEEKGKDEAEVFPFDALPSWVNSTE